MNDTLQQFVAVNIGKPNLGDTPQNKGQCVGLIEVWLDALGVNDPHLWGNAIDLLKNADPSKFDVVYNKPGDTTQFPPDGAVVVLGAPYGKQPDGTYLGHTGLSNKSSGVILRLFEQNDPLNGLPQIRQYDYTSCVGWLVPKLQGGDTVADMYTLPSGKQVDLANRDSNIATATIFDQVMNQGLWIKKTDIDMNAQNKLNQIKQIVG